MRKGEAYSFKSGNITVNFDEVVDFVRPNMVRGEDESNDFVMIYLESDLYVRIDGHIEVEAFVKALDQYLIISAHN